MKRTLWRLLVGVCVIVVSVTGTRVVQAAFGSFEDRKGTIELVRQDTTVSTSSIDFEPVPNMAAFVETKEDGILVIRFAAQGLCLDNDMDLSCVGHVDITIDGTPAPPSSSPIFMNSAGQGSMGYLALAIDRARSDLAKGGHTVAVHFRASDAGDSFNLTNMLLTVQVFRGR